MLASDYWQYFWSLSSKPLIILLQYNHCKLTCPILKLDTSVIIFCGRPMIFTRTFDKLYLQNLTMAMENGWIYACTVRPAVRDPQVRDRPTMEDSLICSIVLFGIDRYTSDERPPLLKECLLVKLTVISHHRFHCIEETSYNRIACEVMLWSMSGCSQIVVTYLVANF